MTNDHMARFSMVLRVAALGALLGVTAVGLNATTLRYVTPGISTGNRMDVVLMDSKLRANQISRYACRSHFTDFDNIIRGQFGGMMRNTVSKSVLMGGIENIVCLGSKEEVIWIDAKRIVTSGAVVKNGYSFRNWTFVNLPGSPMGRFLFSEVHKLAVSVRLGTSPEPARFRLVYIRPESCLQSSRPVIGAKDGTETSPTVNAVTLMNLKSFSA